MNNENSLYFQYTPIRPRWLFQQTEERKKNLGSVWL